MNKQDWDLFRIVWMNQINTGGNPWVIGPQK